MKLAVFDIDGTLISKKNWKVPASTISALNKLHANGVKLAIASGRPPFALEKSMLENIPFDYYICSNGAYVGDLKEEVIYLYQHSFEETEKLVKFCRQEDIQIMFQAIDHFYCYHGYNRICKMVSEYTGKTDWLIDCSKEEHCDINNLPLAVVAHANEKQLEMMQQRFPQFIYTLFSKDFYDVNGNHTKASGVEHLCDKLNIKMENVIAFGDDFNDEAIIKAVKIGVVMGNGREKMKEIADFVTKDVDDGGIAYALKHFGLI